MSHPAHLVTADELARFPNDDYRYELVEGRVIKMSPTGEMHGVVVVNLGIRLAQHVKSHDLGAVMTDAGFKLASNPDTVRAPDVSFVRRERIPASGLPSGFWDGPPDLAVEILSPDVASERSETSHARGGGAPRAVQNDRSSEVLQKVDEYLTSGVRLVWVVDPLAKTVTAWRRLMPPITLGAGAMLDADDVVPGFRCELSQIFE